MRYDIVALPKTRWKGTEIPLTTRSDSYYDVEISPLDHDGCTVSLVRKAAEKEIVHTPDEYDFPDMETQSCNTKAIGFYLHQGFELIGLDTCCYTNDDIGRREVRINLGFFFHREGRRR